MYISVITDTYRNSIYTGSCSSKCKAYIIDNRDYYVTGIGNSQFIAYDDNFAGIARVTFGARDLECIAIDTNRAYVVSNIYGGY